jgi:enediyne biosynthesis protein E4
MRLILASLLLVTACSDDDAPIDAAPIDAQPDALPDAGIDAGPTPGPAFAELCGDQVWNQALSPALVSELSGAYLGHYPDLPAGTLEMAKVIPPHPFLVQAIRVAFDGGTGVVRIRLMATLGHSYPAGWPDLTTGTGDLVAPIEVELTEAPDETAPIDFDVSAAGVFLLPTEHYLIVYEHVGSTPTLAVEELAAGVTSNGLMIVPGESTPYGVDGNFRMQLVGQIFCPWSEVERSFGEATDAAFATVASQRAAFTDLDGDGHDDLILNNGAPQAYLGNGAGAFAAPAWDPFPGTAGAGMLVFADLDDDGDEDAFAATYIQPDSDGDDVWRAGGDCDDNDAAVHPGAAEVAGNGIDDNCDGVVDDGASTADGDTDGESIAAGDCNDTRADVHHGAPELLDGRDNDCDGAVDEDFSHHILTNDGAGVFGAAPAAGVEVQSPGAAAAFGDGDGDGDLDLYVGNWLVHYPDPASVPDLYFAGAGDGTFVDATTAAGMVVATPEPAYGVLWTDVNDDGHQDVWVGNYGYGMNYLWQGAGDGTFTEVGAALGLAADSVGAYGGNTFGGDFGDIDNDGDLDHIAANIAHPRYYPWSDQTQLLVNEGTVFSDQRDALGVHWDEGDVNAAFGDYDNDGDLDLVIASLYPGHYSRFYRNDGAVFTDVTYQTGTAVEDAVSPVWSDVDEDGDLDLVIADRTGPTYVHLFINRVGHARAWIELVLEGTTSNRDAIGARVTVSAGGVTQIREVKGGGGHSNTQSTRVVHVGLGDATAIDGATVRWVGGSTETITGLSPGHRYRVVEGSGTGVQIF